MRVVSACLLALFGCGTDPDSFGRCDSNISVAGVANHRFLHQVE